MLSSEYIHEKILDTTSCSSEDVRKLAELMELYPYVSSFPILYLKALSNSKDVRLESEIEKYAYRISSRAVLFELLHQRFEEGIFPETKSVVQDEVKNTIPETIVVEKEIVPEVQVEIVEEIENPVSETITVEEEILPEVQTEIIKEVENPVSETIVIEEKILPEVQAEIVEEVEKPVYETIEIEEEIVPKHKAEIVEEVENPVFERIEDEEEIIQDEKSEEFKRENDQLEQLIQASAFSSSFMETNFQEEEKETKLETEIEKTLNSELVTEKKIEINYKEEKTEIEPKSERSFSSWLSLGATTSTIIEEEKEKVIQAEIKEEPKKIEYYNFEKPKKEFYSPVKKAKESLSENNMPVSETLAKIFALQGNYPKSIYVYEQLILIFPEKKSFFATQIKNLKKKINS